MADQETERRLAELERQVGDLKRRMDELVRLLKRAQDDAVQYAARKAR